MIEPRSRSVDPAIMMESLFRLTELEKPHPAQPQRARRAGACRRCSASPRRCASGSTIAATVLQRRSRHRLAAIERRLEILRGLLIVYLDLDRVIRIIREEDEPKPELMRVFELTELQANAILDTRLRSLRRLEEMELKRELDALTGEKGGDREAARLGRPAMEGGHGRDPRGAQDLRARDAARPPPDELRRGAGHLRRSTSPRRWWSASRSRWSSRGRAGSGR